MKTFKSPQENKKSINNLKIPHIIELKNESQIKYKSLEKIPKQII